MNTTATTAQDLADRLSAYGVRHDGEIVGHEYHAAVDYADDVTLAEVAQRRGKITRIRLLHEAGRFDVSYVHATIDGKVVPVNLSGMPSSGICIPRAKLVGELIEWAKAEGVYAKGINLLDDSVRAILW